MGKYFHCFTTGFITSQVVDLGISEPTSRSVRSSHFVSLHIRLALGFLVAIQQFLTSEVSELPEFVEWADWANFIYSGLSHAIHGTGIFTT